MNTDPGILSQGLSRIRERMDQAARRAGRSADEIDLIAVTKAVDATAIQTLYDLGVRHFGENRVPAAEAKMAAVNAPDAIWHMIGNVQRRKAKDVVRLFNRVDSVDRIEVGHALGDRAHQSGQVISCLLEVNVSGEASKHGFDPAAAGEAIAALQTVPGLRIEGLLTMAPYEAPAGEIRGYFARLRHLAEDLRLSRVSMGMSDDFEIAIEEGATEVRIGTALYEGM